MIRRTVVLVAIALAGWIGMALPASAHPLGNFSVNVYNGIVVAPDEVRIEHVIDVAEVPTVQAMPTMDANGDDTVTSGELAAFARQRCQESLSGLEFRAGGATSVLTLMSSNARLVDGQAGLSTTRIECSLHGSLAITGAGQVAFSDDGAAGEVGWHEVTLQGDQVTVSDADVPTTSASEVLTAYPASQQTSPMRVTTASAQVAPGGPALVATEVGSASDGGTNPWEWAAAFLGTVSSTASGPIGMTLAVLVALLVGAMHALAPGHGKSLVAFALAGRQERAGRAALTVGATVTATHTASVLVLGLLVAGATSVVPGALFSVINVATGAIVLVLGLVLVRNAVRRPGRSHLQGRSHGHPHPHSHDGPGHAHSHAHPHEAQARSTVAVAVHEHTHTRVDHVAELPTARRSVLVTLGITGGLLPSPSAVVVLLAAATAGRAWYGVLLVLAFGVGMALTLAGVGFAVLRGQERLLAIAERSPKPWMNQALRKLPVVTASAVVLVGIALLITALG